MLVLLVLIKLLHTLIWAIMAAATLFIFYAGIVGLSGPLLTFTSTYSKI